LFQDKTIDQVARKLVSLHAELDEVLPLYAQARSNYDMIDRWTKDVYYTNIPDEGTEIVKRKFAEISKEYKDHRKGLDAAGERYSKLSAQKTAIIMKIESYRSILSAKKEEVRSLG